jgi:hypothetical protein
LGTHSFIRRNTRGVAYVGGIVEGLAFARWIADNRSTEGRDCILNWYLANDNESVRFNRQIDFLMNTQISISVR